MHLQNLEQSFRTNFWRPCCFLSSSLWWIDCSEFIAVNSLQWIRCSEFVAVNSLQWRLVLTRRCPCKQGPADSIAPTTKKLKLSQRDPNQQNFLITKIVAVGAVELYTHGFSWKFQAGADFEVKSTVATLFCYFPFLFFLHFSACWWRLTFFAVPDLGKC